MEPVVLVTGCSTGIGRSAVEHLARAGCRVVATARKVRDIKDLAGEHVHCRRLDVTDEASMQETVAWALGQWGRIDALVNNAGFGAYLAVEETSDEEVRALFDVNTSACIA